MKKLLSLLLILVLILAFTLGCQKEEISDSYMNQRHGYTLEIPEIWKDKWNKIEIIEEDEGNIVTFAYLFESDQLDPSEKKQHQNFFTIAVMWEDEYKDELNNPPVVSSFLAEKDGHVYLFYRPLDNIILEKDSQEEYSELNLTDEDIIDRFYLEGSKQETIYGEKPLDIKDPGQLVEDKEDENTDLAYYYFEPSVSTIEGKLITRMYYGPPNYGENPDTDAKQYPFILQLYNPIDVIALEDDSFNSDKFEVTEIQVVPKNKEETELIEQYINKDIVIQGTLFEAIFGGHHTDVLIKIDEILDPI